MSWKREPCRNFQRGSCRYGDQCKFLHVAQQQKPNFLNASQEQVKPNPFGFGTGSKSQFFNTNQPKQQQKPNPFGFGVQTGSTSKTASAFGSTNQSHSQTQKFGNKWVRPTNSTPPQQNNTPPEHKCTDPESCKKLIIDDFNNERPMWTLSCYSHFKGLPCDITGDISFEELRVAAYDDAKRGLPMQAIVERERNLLSSKLAEYETLMQNPYASAQSAAKSSLFPSISSSSSSLISQNNAPSQPFSFGQAAPVTNPGPGISSTSPNNVFGQPTVFQAPKQSFSGFESKDQNPGPFGGQFSTQPFGSVSGQYIPNLNSKSVETMQNSAFLASINSIVETKKADDNSKDNSIWLKDKWEVKEIPEEEPPPKFCI